jgi:YfiH family protein
VPQQLTLATPFEAAGDHITIALAGARALFTTRRGGVSTGPYAACNLGIRTLDDDRAVRANRARLSDAHGVRFAWGLQVHDAHVQARTAPSGDEEPDEADGQATATRGVAPLVYGADCPLVAIAAPGAVAAVHAGWRGLRSGVIAAGVAAVRALGATGPPEAAIGPLEAAIGPGAGPCCYEVGDDVRARFDPAFRRGRNLDLKALAAAQLLDAGARAVHDVGLCTICAGPGLFFSHRRDRGVTGRQAAAVWLT